MRHQDGVFAAGAGEQRPVRVEQRGFAAGGAAVQADEVQGEPAEKMLKTLFSLRNQAFSLWGDICRSTAIVPAPLLTEDH